MSKKALENHLEKGKTFLFKRKPTTFDRSPEAEKLKREIQTWNREALSLLQISRGANVPAAEFIDLGRMEYNTLADVKDQIRDRREIVRQYLKGTIKKTSNAPKSKIANRKQKKRRLQRYPYDVCFSFAGEDRQKVQQLYHALKDAGIKVFYDFAEDIAADLWGKNLYDYLYSVYRNEARFCLIFVSKNYLNKAWPSHEHASAKDRALMQDDEYILLLLLDEAKLPGMKDSDGFRKWSEGIDSIKRAIQLKLGKPLYKKFTVKRPKRK